MNIERAFSYVFKDSGWISKLIIGAVMVLIPIIGWLFLLGYAMRIMRQVVSGNDQPLPDWSNFGELAASGLKGWGVAFIWGIPIMILSGIAGNSNSFSFSCILWLLGTAESMFVSAAIVAVAISGQFSDGLQFQRTINRVLANIGNYVIIIVIGFVLSFVAGIGVIACVVGVFATVAYATFVGAHLWGQAYRGSVNNGNLVETPRF